nr:bHLH13 [Bupleurum chinense]
MNSMDIDLTHSSSDWLFDYGIVEDISTVHFPAPPTISFGWPAPSLNCSSNASAEIDCSLVDCEGLKEAGSRKRARLDSSSAVSGSKACREKLRRDKLNERFVELGTILEPGRPPKTDKTAILSDAVRMVTQLQAEVKKLKESNEELQEKIKELKAEKNEIRDEKQRIKMEKEKLEQQVKCFLTQPGYMSHPSTLGAAFSAQGQSAENKLMPFVGYPGLAMWQFMPPAVVDTSQDHVLRPPVA